MNDTAVLVCLLFIFVAALFELAGVGKDPRVFTVVILIASGLLLAARAGAL